MSIRFNSLLAHQLMLLHYLFSAFTVRFNLLSLQLLRRNTKNALTAVYVWILPQCCLCWSMLLDYLAISLLVYAKDTTTLCLLILSMCFSIDIIRLSGADAMTFVVIGDR